MSSCSRIFLLSAFLLLTASSCVCGSFVGKVAYASGYTYLGPNYSANLTNAKTISTTGSGKIAYDYVGHRIYSYYSYAQTSTMYRSDETSSILVQTPPNTPFTDWTICPDDNVLLYINSTTLSSMSILGSTSGVPLLQSSNNYFTQVEYDPLSNKVFLVQYPDQLYRCNVTGADLEYLGSASAALRAQNNSYCQSIVIQKYIKPYNGSVYFVGSCGGLSTTGILMKYLTNGTMVFVRVLGFNQTLAVPTSGAIQLLGYAPLANAIKTSSMYAVITGNSGAYYYPSNVTFVKETYDGVPISSETRLTSYTNYGPMLVFEDPNQKKALELQLCSLAGVFNGTHCICDQGNYGQNCENYCDTRYNCKTGYCTKQGFCQSTPPPNAPPAYFTSYVETIKNINSNTTSRTVYRYFYNASTFNLRTQKATNATDYVYQDYRNGYQTESGPAGCSHSPLTGQFPATLMPSSFELLGSGPCPKKPSKTCFAWSTPDGASYVVTTTINGVAVLYQEAYTTSTQKLSRQYLLSATSFTTDYDWTNISNCNTCVRNPSACSTSTPSPYVRLLAVPSPLPRPEDISEQDE